MKILVSGSSGLIGKELVKSLENDGNEVILLVRNNINKEEKNIYWNYETQEIETEKLESLDVVIHLAGENLSTGKWTKEKKQKIFDSRVSGSKFLCETLSSLNNPPKVFISASAVGYYGDRNDEILTEESEQGKGFLADVCKKWEDASESLLKTDTKVINARFGIILSKNGGLISKVIFQFYMGFGGKIGSGKQYMSWIMLDDVINAIKHCISNSEIKGAVNFVSPNPITNLEFTKTLGILFGKMTIFTLPKFAVKMAFGEMGNELLLSSTRAIPENLIKTGFKFKCKYFENALRYVLTR